MTDTEQFEMWYKSTRGREIDWFGVPDYMQGGFARWILYGIKPGDFLSAVIDNDLAEAFSRADEPNAFAMRSWVMLFYNVAPIGSWKGDALSNWKGVLADEELGS